MPPGFSPLRDAPGPAAGLGRGQGPPAPRQPVRQPGNYSQVAPPAAARTDPALYQWDRLSTEQQQAVLRTIRLSQRGGTGRWVRVALALLVIVGLLAAFAVLALSVFHLGGVTLPGL